MDIQNLAQRTIDFTLVFVSIYTERAAGLSTPLAEIVARHGFGSEADFWETFLSEPCSVDLFIHYLRDCLLPPAFLPTTDPISGRPITWADKVKNDEGFLRLSMKDAFNQHESFFVEGRDGKTYVRPREAVEWMLSSPKRHGLVPSALQTFLHPISQTANAVELVAPGNRGPKPVKGNHVKAEMRKLDPKQLSSMKEEEMAVRFDASRDTCRAARRAVLSEK